MVLLEGVLENEHFLHIKWNRFFTDTILWTRGISAIHDFPRQKEKCLPVLLHIVCVLDWQIKMTSGKNFRKLSWSDALEKCDLCGEAKSEGSVWGMGIQMKYETKDQAACIH